MNILLKSFATLVVLGVIVQAVFGTDGRRRIPLRSNILRNSRQTPAIPALYSAPKPQQPEVPALYSAPKPEAPEVPALYSAPKSRSQEENQVDFEGGTTETGGQSQTTAQPDAVDSDEGVSEDYQIAGMTAIPNEDPAQNEFPTESPEDSYFSRGAKSRPDVLYGPPQPSTFDQVTRRPMDQQQIENTPFQHQIQIHVVSPHLGLPQDHENQISQSYGVPSGEQRPHGEQYLPPNEPQSVRNYQDQPQSFQEPTRGFQPQQREEQGGYTQGQYPQLHKSQVYQPQPEVHSPPEYQRPRAEEQGQDHQSRSSNAGLFQPQHPQAQQVQQYQGYQSHQPEQYPRQESNGQPQGYVENREYPQQEAHQPETRQPETHQPEIRQPQSSGFGGYEIRNQNQEPEVHLQQRYQQFDQQSANTQPSQQEFQPTRQAENVPERKSQFSPVLHGQQSQGGYSGPQEQFSSPQGHQQGPISTPSHQIPAQRGTPQGQNAGQQGKSAGGYLPPGGRSVFNQMEERTEDLEGLNGHIVDAALLQRVQQIIEEHERQQKALINNIQRDNEAAFTNTNGQGGYQSNYQTPTVPENPERLASNQPFGFPSPNNEGSRAPFETNRPQDVHQEQIYRDVGNNIENQRPQEVKGRSEEPLVEYQKAVLSTHFTQTEPIRESSKGYLPPPPPSGQAPFPQTSSQFYETAAPNALTNSNPNNQQVGPPNPAYQPVVLNSAYQPAAPNQAYQQVQAEGQRGYNNVEVQLGAGLLVGSPQQISQQNREPVSSYGPQNELSFQSGSPFQTFNQGSQSYGSPNPFHQRSEQHSFGNFVRDNSVAPTSNQFEGSPSTGFDQSGGNDIPRPVYGIPLAPVIGLDSNENLKVVDDEGQTNEVGGQLLSNVVTLPVHDFSPSQQVQAQFHQPSEIFYGRNRRRVGRVARLFPSNRTPSVIHI